MQLHVQVQIEYDNKSQMERIQTMVMAPEVLFAVFDEKGRGSGFVGITDRRLIFLDMGVLRKKKHIISLPYSQLTCVASEDSGGIVFNSSTLVIVSGQREWDFEFHTREKAHRAYQLIMWNLLQNERGSAR